MDAKPKLLLVVTLSEWGGAQHIVSLLAAHLRDEYEITIACAPGGPLVKRGRAAGARVIEVPQLCRNPHPIKDCIALWQLYRLMKRERFDIVHTHSTKAGLLGRLAAYWAKIPVILFTAHGWAFTEGRSRPWRWLLAQVERFAAAFSTKIICVSEHDRQLAIQFGVAPAEKLLVIHNGIDVEPFCSLEDKRAVRRQRGVDESLGIITLVGRLASPKDFQTLTAAWEGLRTPGWQVWIVGEGPLRSHVEQVIQARGLRDQVVLLGERQDVPEILKMSDIFVLPSRWEGMPLTIIEAMLAGLPVIATRVGGISELVEDEVTGILVPPRDPLALRGALARLLEDAKVRRRMGELGRQRALERFTAGQMIARTRALYCGV